MKNQYVSLVCLQKYTLQIRDGIPTPKRVMKLMFKINAGKNYLKEK